MEELVSHIKEQIGTTPLSFVPGIELEYNNINYQLLTYIITMVSGQDCATYMSENIFEPLEMNLAGLEYVKGGSPAIGFTGDGTEKAAVAHWSVTNGAGGLKMSVPDIVKWQQELERLGRGDPGLISRESFKAMITPGVGGYGYGFAGVSQNDLVYSHTGWNTGGTSCFTHRNHTGVFVFSNNDKEDTWAIAN